MFLLPDPYALFRYRYSYESVSSIPRNPLYFTERYLDVKKSLANTFFGPPKEGVYSASVQGTLFQMAKAVLNRFPDISSIQLKMPNIHFLPVNISSKENTIVKFNDDVFLPTDEPHGSIEASLSRFWSKIYFNPFLCCDESWRHEFRILLRFLRVKT
uniref:factor independent urate hydroxylase n=1 Tax=Salix viminalis TaxID=40686 RepID=A0A6N2M1A7_SALVM